MVANFLNMRGLDFIEFSCNNIDDIQKILEPLGFSRISKHKTKNIYLFQQGGIYILANSEQSGFSSRFFHSHGNSVCSIAFSFLDPIFAYRSAIRNGGRPVDKEEKNHQYPAIYGIGNTLIYFVNQSRNSSFLSDFKPLAKTDSHEGIGFKKIDHITNNVFKGEIVNAADFYQRIFGFTKIKEFNITGRQTGLRSLALRSPDGSFSLPINEGIGDSKNQINEYLHMHNGPGIQHVAFHTEDIFRSCEMLAKTEITTLRISKIYYEYMQNKFPWLDINLDSASKYNILIDSERKGSYLLQIFTEYLFGPIFFEIIQRNNEDGFLDGNFQSLFESLENNQGDGN